MYRDSAGVCLRFHTTFSYILRFGRCFLRFHTTFSYILRFGRISMSPNYKPDVLPLSHVQLRDSAESVENLTFPCPTPNQ